MAQQLAALAALSENQNSIPTLGVSEPPATPALGGAHTFLVASTSI